MHEEYAMALKPRNLYSQQFLSIISIPDSNLVDGSSSKYFREAMREHNIIDTFIVASIT
jgi:hypothetical protein